MYYAKILADTFSVKEEYTENIISLLDEGNTIPFIARYRKEMHGTMDDQTIGRIADKLEYLRNLDSRRDEVEKLISDQCNMTDEIKSALASCETLTEIEDIYRPFRPKRKTRASVAKSRGLEPLALELIKGSDGYIPEKSAKQFINPENEIHSVDDALSGARDIIAEIISDDAEIRRRIRNLVCLNASLISESANNEKSVYEMYYEFSEAVNKIAGHRVLAINRGEKEGFLKVAIDMTSDKPLAVIYSLYLTKNDDCNAQVRPACEDSYSRLIFPSIEREIRAELTDRACENAINLFGVNLRQLLLAPPIKNKPAIGLDPGYRTGCKVVAVDATGKILDTSVIYITHGEAQKSSAKVTIKNMIKKHGIKIIAIGNGTASKETEMFTAEVLSEISQKVFYMVVSEAGASVYSASKLAAQEMPDFDLTLRSAVSIARRLQDPLAELVKIDPKAIGVGQYQHDMPQKKLKNALDRVVEDCVNNVGADLNTASQSLLSHISGLSAAVCKNIVAYRDENGRFISRNELKKVSKLGPKAYEQCAGFLRVDNGKNPLDNTGVHPESYACAENLLKHFGFTLRDIEERNLGTLEGKAKSEGLDELSREIGVGVPTLVDIIKELTKPARDPRDELPPPLLRSDVLNIDDLKPGMVLKGTVRNVIDFGAFIDIGVHQDGLVHISRICDRFIHHPGEVLSVGDVVTVKIIEIDASKKRISLSMREI